MKRGLLIVLAALVTSGPSLGASADISVVDAVIKNLDLTSFPNSVGPRRMPGKTSFSDYGFAHVEKTGDGAELEREDGGWAMNFHVISAGPDSLRLCFGDGGVARPGDVRAPSYNTTSALFVSKAPKGRRAAKEVPEGFPNCKSDPPVN